MKYLIIFLVAAAHATSRYELINNTGSSLIFILQQVGSKGKPIAFSDDVITPRKAESLQRTVASDEMIVVYDLAADEEILINGIGLTEDQLVVGEDYRFVVELKFTALR